MDRAVLHAYGWDDIPTDCEFLLDYEIDEETQGHQEEAVPLPLARRRPRRGARPPDRAQRRAGRRRAALRRREAPDPPGGGAEGADRPARADVLNGLPVGRISSRLRRCRAPCADSSAARSAMSCGRAARRFMATRSASEPTRISWPRKSAPTAVAASWRIRRDRVALLQDVEPSERRRELEAAALGQAGRIGGLVGQSGFASTPICSAPSSASSAAIRRSSLATAPARCPVPRRAHVSVSDHDDAADHDDSPRAATSRSISGRVRAGPPLAFRSGVSASSPAIRLTAIPLEQLAHRRWSPPQFGYTNALVARPSSRSRSGRSAVIAGRRVRPESIRREWARSLSWLRRSARRLRMA